MLTTVPALRQPKAAHRGPRCAHAHAGRVGQLHALGTAVALLIGPLVMADFYWPAWWWLTAAFSLGMALWVAARVLRPIHLR